MALNCSIWFNDDHKAVGECRLLMRTGNGMAAECRLALLQRSQITGSEGAKPCVTIGDSARYACHACAEAHPYELGWIHDPASSLFPACVFCEMPNYPVSGGACGLSIATHPKAWVGDASQLDTRCVSYRERTEATDRVVGPRLEELLIAVSCRVRWVKRLDSILATTGPAPKPSLLAATVR